MISLTIQGLQNSKLTVTKLYQVLSLPPTIIKLLVFYNIPTDDIIVLYPSSLSSHLLLHLLHLHHHRQHHQLLFSSFSSSATFISSSSSPLSLFVSFSSLLPPLTKSVPINTGVRTYSAPTAPIS